MRGNPWTLYVASNWLPAETAEALNAAFAFATVFAAPAELRYDFNAPEFSDETRDRRRSENRRWSGPYQQ